jgi:TfoX N-terminal domain
MPSSMTPPPAELVARFDQLSTVVPEADRRQMFGYPTCVLRGHMFMGLHRDSFILRLSDADRREFLDRYAATPFEPMPGRPMRDYVVVPPAVLDSDDMAGWIRRAVDNAAHLPAKQSKKKGRPSDTQR